MKDELISGDTLNYTARMREFSPDAGWGLKFRLVPRADVGSAITLLATAGEGVWVVQAHAPITATWLPGMYNWAAWVEKGQERYTVESGQLKVLQDPRTMVPGVDARSETLKAYEAVTLMITGRATDGVKAYTINGRQLERYAISELLHLQSRLRTQLAQERRAQGIADSYGSVQRVMVRIR